MLFWDPLSQAIIVYFINLALCTRRAADLHVDLLLSELQLSQTLLRLQGV